MAKDAMEARAVYHGLRQLDPKAMGITAAQHTRRLAKLIWALLLTIEYLYNTRVAATRVYYTCTLEYSSTGRYIWRKPNVAIQ